ncbi:MAG: hypothetical protein H6843_06805 [Rhodospirillaceae bacterium]|nr:hypothetical protein [Rhodospirillaceae bacterium]
MTTIVHLVLIETAGNQNYIFATNRLREQVGASEIIRRIGTQYVLEAVSAKTGQPLYDEDRERLAANLLDPNKNPPIDQQLDPATAVEVMLATSGKALLLVRDRTVGEGIVKTVTCRSLKNAPGAVVYGAVGDPFTFDRADVLHCQVRKVHEELEALRPTLPAPQARFPLLPVMQPCSSSGLPAAGTKTIGTDTYECSSPVLAKLAQIDPARDRLGLLEDSKGCTPFRSLDKLERFECDWLAYVHADGNGLGSIFLNFQKHRKKAKRDDVDKARSYVEDYKRFSLNLDNCTFAAARVAMEVLPDAGAKQRAFVPLILGGDDLTVVCDGSAAVSFAATYLQEFERLTGENNLLSAIAKAANGASHLSAIAKAANSSSHLSACAGVAVVKPHFPAHRAYELAEALTKSAKTVKTLVGPGCSALDYHVHFDSSGADLRVLRARYDLGKHNGRTTILSAKPYVLTPLDKIKEEKRAWAKNRLWTAADGCSGLDKAVEALSGVTEGLPRNQQHYLREGVFLGSDAGEGRLDQIRHRYGKNQGNPKGIRWEDLHPAQCEVLFFEEQEEEDCKALEETETKKNRVSVRTWLLDALELAELKRST